MQNLKIGDKVKLVGIKNLVGTAGGFIHEMIHYEGETGTITSLFSDNGYIINFDRVVPNTDPNKDFVWDVRFVELIERSKTVDPKDSIIINSPREFLNFLIEEKMNGDNSDQALVRDVINEAIKKLL